MPTPSSPPPGGGPAATPEPPPRRPEEDSGRAGARAAPDVGTRLSAREIHENVFEAAAEELRRPAEALIWSSLAAGLVIGWSFVASAFVASLAQPPLAQALSAAAYPLGFILVIIGRNQLFTENTLEPVIPLLEERTRAALVRMLRLWVIVLVGNLLGALLFAWLLARTPMVNAPLHASLTTLAHEAVTGGFGATLYRAVFAGWLIALTAWLVSATQMTGAQIALIWLTTAPINAFGFRHSIAGSVEAFFYAVSGGAGWGAMIGGFIVPAVIGNIIGGTLFVALINHGQVAAERRGERG
jgi:formate/nitrite transporter FocA (FNT family)